MNAFHPERPRRSSGGSPGHAFTTTRVTLYLGAAALLINLLIR